MPVFLNKLQWYRFVKILISWLGTPYGHFQYEKGKGADCGLFIAACLKEFGVLKEITFNYAPRFWHMVGKTEVILNHILDYIKNNFIDGYTLQRVNDLQKGDIITFRWTGELTNHIGLYLGNKVMINSINDRGVCIREIYKNRITNIYRLIKV